MINIRCGKSDVVDFGFIPCTTTIDDDDLCCCCIDDWICCHIMATITLVIHCVNKMNDGPIKFFFEVDVVVVLSSVASFPAPLRNNFS